MEADPMQARQFASPAPRHTSPTTSLKDETEERRLTALDAYDILDTPAEEDFDRITRLARKLFGVPVAIVSFIDAHRQWYKSCVGVTHGEVPSGKSFCKLVIDYGEPMVVGDASKDARFAGNQYVLANPGVRFYAGVPLISPDGHSIGTICIVDFRPREFTDEQRELLRDLAQMVMHELELRILARRDSLTGALSRHAFKEEAKRATALALRHHQPLSLIALDVDRFKAINDTYGHGGGDLVLSRIAHALLDALRETDSLGRIGGEEFAVLLPNTRLDGAMQAAEKLRSAVEKVLIEFGSKEIRATASFGVASLDPATQDLETLLAHADTALYEAKGGGRNRCAAWRSPANGQREPRRRVLKSGAILFNRGLSTIDCTVRSLSDEGAGIDVSSTVGIPKTFDLAIRADGFVKPCRVLAAGDKHIEVTFI